MKMLKDSLFWRSMSLLAMIGLLFVSFAILPPANAAEPEYTNTNIVIHEVPNDFDPLKATDEELEYYNYPARPKGSQEELEKWEKIVAPGNKWIKPKFEKTNISHKKSKEDLIEASNSLGWSGVVSGTTSERVVGWWNCPKVTSDGTHNPSYSCHWVGLGGSNGSSQLIQAGTESNTKSTGSTEYYAWWEIVGTDKQTPAQVKLSNFPVSYGHSMYVDISFHEVNSKGIASFYIYNQSNGSVTSFSVTDFTNYSSVRNCAEGIGERPRVNGTYDNPFANYNYCNFIVKRSSTYNGSVSALNNITYRQIVDAQTGNILGTSSTYNSTNASFTTYWNAYE